MKYAPAFFKRNEFACPCCGLQYISAALVFHLDMLRRAWGAPVFINSGYRCAKHNYEVKGAATSRHTIGCAADIRTDSSLEFKLFASFVQRLFNRPEWEFIQYAGGYLHVAVPRAERERLWEKESIDVNFS